MIAKYLENTHAVTHNQYHMELLDVFALDHEKKSFTDVGNRYVALILLLLSLESWGGEMYGWTSPVAALVF